MPDLREDAGSAHKASWESAKAKHNKKKNSGDKSLKWSTKHLDIRYRCHIVTALGTGYSAKNNGFDLSEDRTKIIH